MIKSDCAVCYVTDHGFLFPTIASFISLRDFWKPNQGDVFVFLVDFDQSYSEYLTERFSQYAIRFQSIDSRFYERVDERNWNRTHVTKSTLGRFLIGDLLPEHYKRFLYLDGDTIVTACLSMLIEFDPGPGCLAAADDISHFCRNDWSTYGRFVRSYFKGLNIGETQSYFNAGVFIVQRATWLTMASEALEFFLKNTKICLFHDQSAMNAVLGLKRKRLSLAWNFQTPFRYFGLEECIRPSIFHFTQSAKPWMGRVSPWQEFYERFDILSRDIADLQLPDRQISRAKIIEFNRSSFSHRLKLATILRGRLALRRMAIVGLEKNAELSRRIL